MRNMTRAATYSFALMLLLAFGAAESALGANRVAVTTWNVRGTNYGAGCGSKRNLSAVRSQLQQLRNNYLAFGISLDVFAFSEIYRDQALDLASALGIPAGRVAFVQTRPSSGCNGQQFGLAIMSRLPVVGEPFNTVQSSCPTSGPATESRACYQLPENYEVDYLKTSHEHNMLSGVSVILPTGARVRVYNTHLVGDNSVWDQTRPPGTPPNLMIAWQQIQRVAELINGSSPAATYPAVLAGDFNVHPPTSAYWPAYTRYNYLALPWYGFRDLWAEWSQGRTDLANPQGYTVAWDDPQRRKRVDYIVTRDRRIQVLTANVPNTGSASDHRPMVALLTF